MHLNGNNFNTVSKTKARKLTPAGLTRSYQIAFAIFRLHGLICQLN